MSLRHTTSGNARPWEVSPRSHRRDSAWQGKLRHRPRDRCRMTRISTRGRLKRPAHENAPKRKGGM
jgi:hypothetical protein